MEAKLKSLKVVDLKDIIAKASVPAKGNKKADLIAVILANPSCVQVYNQIYDPNLSLADSAAQVEQPSAAPKTSAPENSSTTSATLAQHPQPVAAKPTSNLPATAAAAPEPSDPATAADSEADKRRKRAERFGIPFVEEKAPVSEQDRPGPVPRRASTKNVPTKEALSTEDTDKMKARAARFGLSVDGPAEKKSATETGKTTSKRNQKRAAPAQEAVDAEEVERRKKRAERFGVSTE